MMLQCLRTISLTRSNVSDRGCTGCRAGEEIGSEFVKCVERLVGGNHSWNRNLPRCNWDGFRSGICINNSVVGIWLSRTIIKAGRFRRR